MGKGKRKRERELARVQDRPLAERHGFDTGGLLGHDSTYNVNVTEQVALSIDVVASCVELLADLVADGVIHEYRDTTRLEQDSRIVLRPMRSISRRNWLKWLVATLALYKGSYLWHESGVFDSEGVPDSIRVVPPTRVSWTGANDVYIDGEKVDPTGLTWVPRMVFPTVTRELGTLLRLARDPIAAAFAADTYRADYWEKGGAPTWYVTADQALSNTEADTIKARLIEKRSGAPGEPLVLGKGGKLAEFGADLGLDGTNASLARLASSIVRYFRVPPWLVNVQSEAGSLTYSNASAAGLDLVRYTLQPGYAGPIADAWSDYLPGGYITGRHVVIDLTHLTRGTILEQAQAYQIATGGKPWLLPSEVRSELHMPMDMSLDETGAPAPALEAIA